MLKDKLFKITSISHEHHAIDALLEINAEDEIFKGHFPGHPVLPGACMLQIIKEVLEGALKQSLRVKKADQMKFLSPVDPLINNMLQLKLSYTFPENELYNVTAGLLSKNGVCFKFKGTFVKV